MPEEKRTARFVCAIAAVLPDGRELTTRATIEGRIGYEEKGDERIRLRSYFLRTGIRQEYGGVDRRREEPGQSQRKSALELMKEELKKYEDTDRK